MAKKIVFMGTPMFSVPILKSLYQNGYSISYVYTQPPQKSQRGQKINKSPIQSIAESINLKFRTPKYLKNNKEAIFKVCFFISNRSLSANKLPFKNTLMLFLLHIGVSSVFTLSLYKFEEYGTYFGLIQTCSKRLNTCPKHHEKFRKPF